MRSLWMVLATACCAGSALGDGEQACGTDDNAPCAPVFESCAGSMCADSVYTSNNPDPGFQETSTGGETAQIHVARILPEGSGSGSCTRCGTGGENFTCWNPSFPNTVHANDLPGASFSGSTVTLAEAGTYDVEYCIIMNSNVLNKAASAFRLVSNGVTTYHYGESMDRMGEGNRDLCGRNRVTVAAGATIRLGYVREQTAMTGPDTCRGHARNLAGVEEKYDWMTVTRVR